MQFRKKNKILIAGKFRWPWYEDAFYRSLKDRNNDVIKFNWSIYLPGDGLYNYLKKRLYFGNFIKKINIELIKMVHQEKPDIVFIYAGHPIKPETIQQLKEFSWVTGYHNDDPFGKYGKRSYFRIFRKSIPYYSSHHVYRKKNIIDYRNIGIDKVKLLRAYYCPWLHYPIKSNEKYYNNDIIFIGSGEPGSRCEYIEYLINYKCPLKIYGDKKWERYLKKYTYNELTPIEPAFGEEYNKLITNSKICLAFFNKGNNDLYTRRVFEIPACKGFLLAQRTEIMQELYKEGVEAEYFNNNEELLDKCNFYLNNNSLRNKIANNGYNRCINSGYDIYSKVTQWINDINYWLDISF